ncbi:MAG: flagellar biosynthetic protein FliO [Rhodoferax sp.]|nr:flagellar biosynthetic protein FliO [Rhodoferax sp.]
MTSTLISVGLFVILLALLPVGLKWVQRRAVGGGSGMASASRVISAVAVGPHQRVVTVEVGPEGARTWLTLGVTAQTITCLHSAAVDAKAEMGTPQVIQSALVVS